MFANNHYQFVYARFTREKGFIDIESSLKLSRKKALSILNSFIPQGASPQGSFRISSYDENLGAGYYWMESASVSHLFTLLIKKKSIGKGPFMPPYPLDKNGVLSKRNLVYSQEDGVTSYYENLKNNNLLSNFNSRHFSSILYSILAGDNILIVHPDANQRMTMIQLLLSILPHTVFNYNRITSGCQELDGNENIVGVDQLPRKYRSAKKLYLPTDTIFVDLINQTVEGEGVKTCNITDSMTDALKDDIEQGYYKIYNLFKSIKSKSDFDTYDVLDQKFIERVQNKLGLKPAIKEEWLMF